MMAWVRSVDYFWSFFLAKTTKEFLFLYLFKKISYTTDPYHPKKSEVFTLKEILKK